VDTDASFGTWLKQRRKALDLTQAELARRSGCAMATVQKIEADKRRPSREIADRFAAVLEIPPEERATFVKFARSDLAVDLPGYPRGPIQGMSRLPRAPEHRVAGGPPMPPEVVTGTITFLFTDIEGSTQLWERHAQAMSAALARYKAVLREIITRHGGAVLQAPGDGLHAAFVTAPAAAAAAVAAQGVLATETWPEIGALRARMALHTGLAEMRIVYPGCWRWDMVARSCSPARLRNWYEISSYPLWRCAIWGAIACRTLPGQSTSFNCSAPTSPMSFPRSRHSMPCSVGCHPSQLLSLVATRRVRSCACCSGGATCDW